MSSIIGIDLGSHSVKVAVLQVGFRSVSLSSVQTFEVLSGEGEALERSLSALRGFGAVDEGDGVTVAMPGDRVLLRTLDIPFTDPRKLLAVVGIELADDLPCEMEDVVFDQVALPAAYGQVLAGAVRSAEVDALLSGLESQGMRPRHLAVAPLAYTELIRRVHPDGMVGLIDIGHERTNVCLVRDGRTLAGRTISGGGHQITEAIRRARQIGYQEAQTLKENEALLAVELHTLAPDRRQLAEVTAKAFAPLLRDVQQTLLVSGERLGGGLPDRLLLCGGTALLDGVAEYIGAETGIPTTRLTLVADEQLDQAGLSDEGELVGALALGMTLEHGRRPTLELRQGPFAYMVDRSVLRDKVGSIAISLVAVLIFAALSAYASLHALRTEEQVLEAQLSRATTRVFGKPLLNPSRVLSKLKRSRGKTSASIPPKTAVDVLDLLSQRIPRGAEGTIDVTRLDVKEGKTYLKGTADSGSTVGKMVKLLEDEPCFKNVRSGKISSVAGGKKEFTVTITTGCF